MSTIQLTVDTAIQGGLQYLFYEGTATSSVGLELEWSCVCQVEIQVSDGGSDNNQEYRLEFTTGEPGTEVVFAMLTLPKGKAQISTTAQFNWPSGPVAVRMVCDDVAANHKSPFKLTEVTLTGE